MQPPADAAQARRIGYDAFRGFSKLFSTYCDRFEDVSEFYRLDFQSEADRLTAVADAAAHPRDRATLVSVLRGQQAAWGDDSLALANVERLLDPRSVAVVTGQQVGLFTGPLYTVLKALSTVLVARRLEKETGHPAIPVFWLGAEDHDLAEMNVTGLPSGSDLSWIRYSGHQVPETGNLGSVGALEFTDAITEAIGEAEALLPPTDFRDTLLEAVRFWYRPGATFKDAFGGLLRHLLPGTGLVLMSSDAPEFKRLAAPLWRREIEDWATPDARLRAASEQLADRFHAQVHIRPTNLFVLHEGQRLPLDAEGDRFVVRGSDLVLTKDEALDLLDREPERFSPNVVLRPLTQDTLLPTAAYVSGPGETAYFAQYRQVYEWAGIPMPLIYPRVSLTLVERRIRRSLDKLGRDVPDFDGDIEALFTGIVKEQMQVDVDRTFGQAMGAIQQALSGLKPDISSVDPSLGKTLEATRASVSKELARLKERVVRAERRNQQAVRDQVDKITSALFPLGKPQERAYSALYFANKYGPDFFVSLMDRVDADTSSHFVIDL